MDLFDSLAEPQHNLLPFDGEAFYLGTIFTQEEADYYFDTLKREIEWSADQLTLYGKQIHSRRTVAWHGDKPYRYSYSNNTKVAKPWSDTLKILKDTVQQETKVRFNACLLNYYHSGKVGMAWHSDDETELIKQHTIASISFGESRDFVFKHKTSQKKVGLKLANGSLLIMRGSTQQHWLHSLPIRQNITAPRINLTFRAIAEHTADYT